MEERLQRIAAMESLLQSSASTNRALAAQLNQLAGQLDGMAELFAYYGSDIWFEDTEAELPEGFSAGVLSEDLVYDEVTALRDNAIRMLELATDILKNRI